MVGTRAAGKQKCQHREQPMSERRDHASATVSSGSRRVFQNT
jgi:hypothetical protein